MRVLVLYQIISDGHKRWDVWTTEGQNHVPENDVPGIIARTIIEALERYPEDIRLKIEVRPDFNPRPIMHA